MKMKRKQYRQEKDVAYIGLQKAKTSLRSARLCADQEKKCGDSTVTHATHQRSDNRSRKPECIGLPDSRKSRVDRRP